MAENGRVRFITCMRCVLGRTPHSSRDTTVAGSVSSVRQRCYPRDLLRSTPQWLEQPTPPQEDNSGQYLEGQHASPPPHFPSLIPQERGSEAWCCDASPSCLLPTTPNGTPAGNSLYLPPPSGATTASRWAALPDGRPAPHSGQRPSALVAGRGPHWHCTPMGRSIAAMDQAVEGRGGRREGGGGGVRGTSGNAVRRGG